MAREKIEEKLLKEIGVIDDTLFTLEHPDMGHIKNVYFNSLGQHFFIARKFEGKLYSQLSLEAVDVTDNKPFPKDEHIVFVPDTGSPSTVTAQCAPQDTKCHIVKTLTKAEAIDHFEELLKEKRAQYDSIMEHNRPVVKSEKRSPAKNKAKPKAKAGVLNTKSKKAA